jgi:hypothetical protein
MDSSRIGLFIQGSAVVFLAAFAGCSSSSPAPAQGNPANTGDAGDAGSVTCTAVPSLPDGGSCPDDPALATIPSEDNDAGAAAETVVNGSGAACPALTTFTTATKITVQTTWPATIAVDGCTSTSATPCTAPFTIWLLSDYTVTGTTLAVSSQTCGNQSPIVHLNAAGSYATGVPSGMTGEVLNQFPLSVWTAKDMPITKTTGTIGTWNVGSSFSIAQSTSLLGLNATSTLSDPATAWPSVASGLSAGDLADSDDDGHPGITGTPATGCGFYDPRTSLSPTSPAADQLYIASRTTLSLYGVATSCDTIVGRAFISQLQNHIIGCQETDTTKCVDGDQTMGSGFIDSNTTQFVPGPGTFVSKQLTQGATATCADVIAAFPADSCP